MFELCFLVLWSQTTIILMKGHLHVTSYKNESEIAHIKMDQGQMTFEVRKTEFKLIRILN